MYRRLVRLLAGGADAVQVACKLGVSLQRAQALIEEVQGASARAQRLIAEFRGTPAPCAAPVERGGDTCSAMAGAAPSPAWPAGGPSEAPPPASANAGDPECPLVSPARTGPDEPAAPPPPPARPFCRFGGRQLPLSQAVLDALGIELARR